MPSSLGLEWLVNAYGHCLPRNVLVSGPEFALIIRETYDCSKLRNKLAANFAHSCSGTFYNRRNVWGYSLTVKQAKGE